VDQKNDKKEEKDRVQAIEYMLRSSIQKIDIEIVIIFLTKWIKSAKMNSLSKLKI